MGIVLFVKGRVHLCICGGKLKGQKVVEMERKEDMLCSRRFYWEWTPNVHTI
jgi:hypothetical protein